jgi:hypothetical protein
MADLHDPDTRLTTSLPPKPAPSAKMTSANAGHPVGGAPRRNPTADPILTIDAPRVRNALQHPTTPHDRAGENRCRGLRRGRGEVACGAASGKSLARPVDPSGHECLSVGWQRLPAGANSSLRAGPRRPKVPVVAGRSSLAAAPPHHQARDGGDLPCHNSNCGGVALFLIGTTYLWLTPAFASPGCRQPGSRGPSRVSDLLRGPRRRDRSQRRP